MRAIVPVLLLAAACASAPDAQRTWREPAPDWAWELTDALQAPHAVQVQLWGFQLQEIFHLAERATAPTLDEARARVETLRASGPSQELAEALYVLGNIEPDRQLSNARYADSVEVLGSLAQDAASLYAAGRALHLLGREREALEAYERSLAADPRDGQVFTMALIMFPSEVEVWNKWRRRGSEFFETAIRGEKPPAALVKEYVYFRIVRDMQRQIIRMQDRSYQAYLRSLSEDSVALYMEQSEPFFNEKNVELLAQAVELAPVDGEAHALRASMLVGRAFAEFLPAVQQIDRPPEDQALMARFHEEYRKRFGPVLREAANHMDRAESLLGRKLAFTANDRGFVYLGLGRYDEAVAAYLEEQALTDSIEPFLKAYLARWVEFGGLDHESARASVLAIMDKLEAWCQTRRGPEGWYTLGRMAESMSDFPKAESSFRRALAEKSDWWKARFSLAAILIKSARRGGNVSQEASMHLRDALEALRHDPEAQPTDEGRVREALALFYVLAGQKESAIREAGQAASDEQPRPIARRILYMLGSHETLPAPGGPPR